MSSTEEAPEDMVDTSDAGGFGEVVPEPLMPIWKRIERVQKFRDTHGETYTNFLEGIVSVVLTGGYLYWLYLFITS